MDRLIEAGVHGCWLTRRLPARLAEAGFGAEARDWRLFPRNPALPCFRLNIDRIVDVPRAVGDAPDDGVSAETRRRVETGCG